MAALNSPSRPERSSARASVAGHSAEDSTDDHGTNGGGISGVAMAASNGVVNAYNRAPDLGVNSTVNSAYQRAPDLGVGATISKYLGQGQGAHPSTMQKQGSYRKEPQQDIDDDDDEYEHERVIRPDDADKKRKSQEREVATTKETRREESERLGPSDESRIGKSQMQIGTETGIPTAAGAGTTVSADESNLKALEKAVGKGSVKKAHVPEDFEALYCPTENAGTGKSDNVTRSLNNEPSQQSEGGKNQEKASRKSTSGYSNRSSGSHDYHYTHASAAAAGSAESAGSEKRHSQKNQTVMTSDGNEYEVEKRRSFGEKLKDQIKGEFKILSGTMTNNDEKIIQGLHIKEGDHD